MQTKLGVLRIFQGLHELVVIPGQEAFQPMGYTTASSESKLYFFFDIPPRHDRHSQGYFLRQQIYLKEELARRM